MSIEVNGQVFDTIEDYEQNYVISDMDVEGITDVRGLTRHRSKHEATPNEMVSKEQSRYATQGMMKAIFLVLAVFGISILGFIGLLFLIW